MAATSEPIVPNGDLTAPVAIFDSGIGGLSVLRHVRRALPHETLVYLADQAHIPYGARSQAEISALLTGITRFLVEHDSKMLVVACNTASAAALTELRRTFPRLPIVGMEPALKPAAAATRNGRIGVLATQGTFASSRYASLMARFAPGLDVYGDPCPGLVERIEQGDLDGPETEKILRQAVEPMLNAGTDVLVLGCTHYPFIMPLLQTIVGEAVTIIDPAPAVARQAANVLQQNQLAVPDSQHSSLRCLTTGDPHRLYQMSSDLLGYPCPAQAVVWQDDRLTMP